MTANDSLVMLSTAEDLKLRAGWDGKEGKSRANVLRSIEGYDLNGYSND
jgi:hypothetical protein